MINIFKTDISKILSKLIIYLIIISFPINLNIKMLIIGLTNFGFVKLIYSQKEKDKSNIWYSTLPIKRQSIILSKFLTVTCINILSITSFIFRGQILDKQFIVYILTIILMQYIYILFIELFTISNADLYTYVFIFLCIIAFRQSNLYFKNIFCSNLILILISLNIISIYIGVTYYTKKDI